MVSTCTVVSRRWSLTVLIKQSEKSSVPAEGNGSGCISSELKFTKNKESEAKRGEKVPIAKFKMPSEILPRGL